MVFDHGEVGPATRVLVLGGAGNVGAYAVQLASRVTPHVVATAAADEAGYVRGLGAGRVVDARQVTFEAVMGPVDVVLDTIGGEVQERSFGVLKPGGVLVSAVSAPDPHRATRHGVRAFFFLVEVSSARLEAIAALIDAGELYPRVGEVLPLAEARLAHDMLAGRPHRRGKIVLAVDVSA
jgi:NADPH:quinone reductase-like Zn-dependent oxidoreductase